MFRRQESPVCCLFQELLSLMTSNENIGIEVRDIRLELPPDVKPGSAVNTSEFAYQYFNCLVIAMTFKFPKVSYT